MHMAKFYKTEKFREVQKEWEKRLKEDGFIDQELPSGNLRESEAEARDHESIRDFFIRLDHFMFYFNEMPKFHRKVMELYANGSTIAEITLRLKISGDKRVRNVVELYKGITLAINRYFLAKDNFPVSMRDRKKLD